MVSQLAGTYHVWVIPGNPVKKAASTSSPRCGFRPGQQVRLFGLLLLRYQQSRVEIAQHGPKRAAPGSLHLCIVPNRNPGRGVDEEGHGTTKKGVR